LVNSLVTPLGIGIVATPDPDHQRAAVERFTACLGRSNVYIVESGDPQRPRIARRAFDRSLEDLDIATAGGGDGERARRALSRIAVAPAG